jgi:peptidyl-dipeptidase A
VTFQRAFLSLAVAAGLAAVAGPSHAQAKPATAPAKESADQFIDRVNAEMAADYREITSAQWLASTYINSDSQLVSSKADERSLAKLGGYVAQARTYEGKPMSPATARALQLLRLGITVPPPKDPASLAELTRIGTKLNGDYGAG